MKIRENESKKKRKKSQNFKISGKTVGKDAKIQSKNNEKKTKILKE